VKISATEPVEEALAFGPKAQSAVYIDHAMERLREIEQLKNSGKLDKRNQVFTKFAFENEISKVNTAIEALNAANDFKDARAVEKALSDNLKKSPALLSLYEVLPTGTQAGLVDVGTVETKNTPPENTTTTVTPVIAAPVTGTPATTSIQSTTTKYVPKLLPQRANIPRGDDDEEDD
jgi:hypothetical protein